MPDRLLERACALVGGLTVGLSWRVVGWWRDRPFKKDMAAINQSMGRPKSDDDLRAEAAVWRRHGHHEMALLLEREAGAVGMPCPGRIVGGVVHANDESFSLRAARPSDGEAK